MDQLRAMLRSLSKKQFDDFLEEIQYDRPESLEVRGNNSGEGENDHLQAIIQGMQRQIDQLARGSAQPDESFEFGIPLSDEIRLCMPPADYKDPKFYKFNGEGDPRRHLYGFKDECELKISVDSRLQAKFFPHSLEGEACEWFYALPERSITSFRELSMLLLEQYKHNIKKELMVSYLYAMRQGSDEKLDKFIVRFKKTWQQIKIKLTEREVNNIFKVIISPLQLHVIDYTHIAFSDMTHKLLEKEKVLVKLGLVKYGEDEKPKAKDKRTQSPKKEKSVHVAKKIDEKKERKFIKFPIPPRFILKDLITKGLLQPLPKWEEDPTAETPAWYKEDRYYEYHQTKGHATNGCGSLRNKIQGLIEDGFYVFPDRVDDTKEEQDVNVIFHEEVCVALARGRPRVITDPVTCERELPKDPRSFDLIEQLKNTQAKVNLFELLQFLEPHREIMNQVFKNSPIDRNISVNALVEKTEIWSKGEIIAFYPNEKPSKDVTKLHPPLFIEVEAFGSIVKRSLIDGGAALNIATTHLLSQFDPELLPPREETTMRVKGFYGVSKKYAGIITLPIRVGKKILKTLFYIMDGKPSFNLILGRAWIDDMEGVASTFCIDASNFVLKEMCIR